MLDDTIGVGAAAPAAEAWGELAGALGVIGEQISAPPFPAVAREAADGYRYLGRLAVLGLQWAVEFGDPDFPAFYRHDDDITKWGGPNVDNRYLRARVRAGNTYRVTGNASTSYGFVVQLNQGDMHLDEHGVYGEAWGQDLVTDDEGSFEMFVSAERPDGVPESNWLSLHPDTGIVSIREYFNDWANEHPGWFDIECLDTEGRAPAPLTPEVMAARLREARRWIDRSVRYWHDYIETARGDRRNFISPPRSVAAGAAGIAYGSGFFDLDDGQAMLIEGGEPDAWHWNFLLYNLSWFESLDIANRVTSLNGSQMHVDADGGFRIVVAHEDPGVPNWLDTSGLRSGMVTYRYIHARTAPAVTCRLVPLAGVRDAVPAATPVVDGGARRRQIATRRAHIARRFRQ